MRALRVAIVLAALLVPTSAHAGGWTQAEGAGYAKVWGTGLFGASGFALDGEVFETEPFRIVTLSAYGEYGLTDDLTLVGQATPLGSAVHGDRAQTFVGPLLAGLRQRFVDGPVQFALEMRGGGTPGIGVKNLAGADADYGFRPTVPNGRFESELQLAVGSGFGWLSIAVGPRLNSTLHDELFAFAQIGAGPFGGFVADLHVSYNEPLGELEILNVTGAGNTRYMGLGLGLAYWFTDAVGINVGADSAIFAQANAAAAPLRAGVEFRTP